MHTEPLLAFLNCPTPPLASDVPPPWAAASGARPVSAGGGARRMAFWDWAPTGDGSSRHAVVCVHGLSRQGRDFDVLARALQPHVRVICPDVAGRGHSDWLADPMAYQVATYVADMATLLTRLRTEGVETLDWVGSSMGGLIGLLLAGQTGLGIRRLVLNDVGPAIEPAALQRIGTYLGLDPTFSSVQEGADYLWRISSSFGAHTPAQWLALSAPMFRQVPEGWSFHYDPAIVVPFRALTAEAAREAAAQGEAMLWQLYDHLNLPVLLLRGGDSDLLSIDTARAMVERGPHARLVEFAGVGHAPTLVPAEQVAEVTAFLLAKS